MKHLFAYCGPVYLVYTLGHYCRGRHAIFKLFGVGAVVITVFATSFGPFIYNGQIEQVFHVLYHYCTTSIQDPDII
jgi:alpha-1,3-glucosyltransferase